MVRPQHGRGERGPTALRRLARPRSSTRLTPPPTWSAERARAAGPAGREGQTGAGRGAGVWDDRHADRSTTSVSVQLAPCLLPAPLVPARPAPEPYRRSLPRKGRRAPRPDDQQLLGLRQQRFTCEPGVRRLLAQQQPELAPRQHVGAHGHPSGDASEHVNARRRHDRLPRQPSPTALREQGVHTTPSRTWPQATSEQAPLRNARRPPPRRRAGRRPPCHRRPARRRRRCPSRPALRL